MVEPQDYSGGKGLVLLALIALFGAFAGLVTLGYLIYQLMEWLFG